eukprot:scaffold9940_cov113-Skeletonema_marinoi.AAC.1
MLSASPNLVLRTKECSYHSERFMEAVLQAGISGYTQDALLRVDEVLMIYMIAEALLHNETDDIEK